MTWPEHLPLAVRLAVVVVAGLAAFLLSRTMGAYGAVMRARADGKGIVALELTRTAAKARDLVGRWGPEGVAAARASLRVDFGFVLSYVVLGVAFAATVARHAQARGWHGAATGVRWAMAGFVVAGACDAIENVLLFRVLDGGWGAQPAAFAFAAVKWVTVLPAAAASLLVAAAFVTPWWRVSGSRATP
jgi:hypothetical protein